MADPETTIITEHDRRVILDATAEILARSIVLEMTRQLCGDNLDMSYLCGYLAAICQSAGFAAHDLIAQTTAKAKRICGQVIEEAEQKHGANSRIAKQTRAAAEMMAGSLDRTYFSDSWGKDGKDGGATSGE